MIDESTRLDRGFERLQVIAERVARVHLRLAERVVRVQAQLLRTATREVLHRQRDVALGAQRDAVLIDLALQRFDELAHDVGAEIGVFSEGLVRRAYGAGLGGEVGHVAVHAAQPDRGPFGAHDLGELLDDRHIAVGGLAIFQRLLAQGCGGDAGFLREGRDAPATG